MMKAPAMLWSTAVLSLTMLTNSSAAEVPTRGPAPSILSHENLEKRLDDRVLRLIDARPKSQYDKGHIPGAVWLDLKVFEPLTQGKGLTDQAAWERAIAPLGIGPDTEVFVYDDDRYHLAAGRAWFWLSYASPAVTVGLVDGGFSAWQGSGHPVSTTAAPVTSRQVEVTFRPWLTASRQDVEAATLLQTVQIVDARSEEEYRGTGVCPISGKPLPGGRAGHLPSAKLLDTSKVVGTDGRFLEPTALRKLLEKAGIEADRPTIVYSKGGARSNAVVFALRHLGLSVRHYVPGLNEWAADPKLPLVTGLETGRTE
jgi:thiosulfate/3-mercaptopyruvate sulfurtransferase